jgi:hypothetical protein
MKLKTVAWVTAVGGPLLLGSVGCGGHEPGDGTGPLQTTASEPLSVAGDGGDAGGDGSAALQVCGVTLSATLVFHGSQRIDGTASLGQPIPFAIPAAVPITSGGTKNGHAQLQFSVGAGKPVTCGYDLQGGGQSFPLSGCDNRAGAGQVESADSFTLQIQTADHGAGASGTEIQLTTVLDAPDGTTCAASNMCFQAYACMGGTCTGSSPVVCAASDQCHAPGTCDPSSGVCSNPSVADGSACNDGNACTQTDSCQSGTCVGMNLVSCTASDACHVAGTCDPTTGTCSNPAVTCSQPDVCIGGSCAPGCDIGGVGYAAGTLNPNNSCQSCSSAPEYDNGMPIARTTWDSVADGTTCGSDGVCSFGSCTSGCYIDGTLYSAGASNPSQANADGDVCQTCQPDVNTAGWSDLPDGTGCGIVNGGGCMCLQGAPTECGEGNEACCGGTTCYDGVCSNGTCQCGAQGQGCCSNLNTGCFENLVCTSDAGCQCGGLNQPCCGGSGGSCGPNLSCVADVLAVDIGGWVCACGASDQACCGGTTCDSPAACVNGSCN